MTLGLIKRSAGRSLLCATALFTAMPTLAATDRTDASVTEAELRTDIAYLASDALEGRYPGTQGETLAVHYIAQQLAAAGFVGGADADGGWYQPVPLVELIPAPGHWEFRRADGLAVAISDIALRAPGGPTSITDVPIIYVGHGVDATGHLMADRAGEGALSLRDRREALVAAGARATLIMPTNNAPFAGLVQGFNASRPQLVSRLSRAEVEGVMSGAEADRLISAAGLDAHAARQAAEAPDYAGAMLNISATLSASTTRRSYNSYNVVARLPGRRSSDGVVALMGHWDHLGICRPEGAADRICNGAVDNASGIAVLLAVARRLGAGARIDRDVMIIATTAEEQGLLGAYHFAASPPVPLASITVLLNVDTVAVAPRDAPMAMVGRGQSPLDAEFDAVARASGRVIDTDLDANAFIRRQDGWALTQRGVPSHMAGGSFSDMPALEAYLGGDYHTPNDELTDETPLGGAADDADLHVRLVRHFASTATHPRQLRSSPLAVQPH
jgi:hypothetical protein